MSWAIQHSESVTRKAFMPQGLSGMLRWFVKAWRDEVPVTMHAGGIEPDSQLGAPKLAPAFRAYVEGRHGRTEHAWSDGRPESSETYATPLLWTLRWLERNRHPLVAAVLRRLGRSAGDYRSLTMTCSTCASSVTLPDEYAEAIARDALNLAWEHYRDAPSAY